MKSKTGMRRLKPRSRSIARTIAAGLLLAGAAIQVGVQAAQQPTAPASIQKISLTAGRSTVLSTDFNITRIAVTNPAIADAVVVQPREVLIDGKSSGTVSLIIWGATERSQYDLVV